MEPIIEDIQRLVPNQIIPNHAVNDKPSEPVNNARLFIIGIAVGIVVLAGFSVWYFFVQKPVTIEAQIVPVSSSTTNSYNELYDLLAKGNISQPGFQIVSYPQKRQVVILVSSPVPQNTIKAQNWLKTNGYSDLPQNNVTFQQAQ